MMRDVMYAIGGLLLMMIVLPLLLIEAIFDGGFRLCRRSRQKQK